MHICTIYIHPTAPTIDRIKASPHVKSLRHAFQRKKQTSPVSQESSQQLV